MSRAALLLIPAAAVAAILALRNRRSPRGAPPSRDAAPAPQPSPPPDVSRLMDPAAFAAFPAWVERFEGSVPTMYQDVLGLITTGVGNLIDSKGTTAASDPPARALMLPWLRPDGALASRAEIRADWQRVKAMAPALVAKHYAGPSALHLSPEAVADLVRRTAAVVVRDVLVKTWPDFPTFPPPAQTALLGMAWGLGSFGKFPTLAAAVRARDWKAAAESCKIKNANASRNDAHRALFLQAAGVA